MFIPSNYRSICWRRSRCPQVSIVCQVQGENQAPSFWPYMWPQVSSASLPPRLPACPIPTSPPMWPRGGHSLARKRMELISISSQGRWLHLWFGPEHFLTGFYVHSYFKLCFLSFGGNYVVSFLFSFSVLIFPLLTSSQITKGKMVNPHRFPPPCWGGVGESLCLNVHTVSPGVVTHTFGCLFS